MVNAQGNPQALRMPCDHVECYRKFGFAVVRGVFREDEVLALREAFERIYAQGLRHGASFRHQNVFFQSAPDPAHGRPVPTRHGARQRA